MPISLPKERVYYYDERKKAPREGATVREPVLLCWVPKEYLEPRTKKKGGVIKDEILTDYPDGVDIGVNAREFGRFRELYGLEFAHDPVQIVVAFKALYESREVRTGQSIRADALEKVINETGAGEMARKVVRSVEARKRKAAVPPARRKAAGQIAPEKIVSAAQVQQEMDRSPALQKEFDRRFLELGRKMSAGAPAGAAPWDDRLFGAISMSDGDAPIQVFYRLQKRSGRR